MEYAIPRICDNHLFQCFIIDVFTKKKISFPEELTFAEITISGKTIEIPREADIENNPRHALIEKIRTSAGFSIESIRIGYKKTKNSDYQRIITSTAIEYKRTSNSFIDRITIKDDHNSDGNLIAFIEISQQLDKFSAYTQNELGHENTDVLSRLEGLSAALIEDVHKKNTATLKENEIYRHEQEKKYTEKTEKRLAELDEEFNKKNDEIKQRESKIIDADNTTARRQVRNDIISSITPKAERFSFSSSINNNIKTIGSICIILAVFGLYVSVTSYNEIILGKAVNDSTLWFHYIKSFSGSAVFLTSLTYLIRWLNQWTNRVANTELDYQQFERDLNRSHLAIEMCLEWKDKKDEPIPEKLLQAMTNGLFITKDDSNKYDAPHPVDQIAAALVKSADKLEIPIGTAIATTSGKNLRKEKISSNS